MKLFLHDIEHLLFDLFQFVFHLYHDVLHFGVVRLAAGGIDFPSHFLGDESQLLALSVSACHRFAEIAQVIGQTLFFFVDVQLFDVIDEFLFQSVLVVVYADGFSSASVMRSRILVTRSFS